jgi:CSLREA domain-containing protein
MPHHRTRNETGSRRIHLCTIPVVLALLALCASGLHLPAVQADATFTVNSTGDGADSNLNDGVCNDGTGNCTLRAAIEQANGLPDTDTITFNIPGTGVRTIVPVTALPEISNPVVIDGYTQPGSSANTLADGDNAVLLIELSGAGAGTPGGVVTDGLSIRGGNSVVRGLVINRFSGMGITIKGNDIRVEGNFIGTTPAGTAKAGNLNGVYINSTTTALGNRNVIGGTSPAARNVISGNSSLGVSATGAANNTLIQGNYIGTDAAGGAKLGNGSHGVSLNSVSNTIGGTAAGARNVISGNGQAGLFFISGNSSVGNSVQGNYIGTDATGTAALGNQFAGVWINFSGSSTVGGSDPAAANIISGNESSGILITGDIARNNQINGNLIGTDASGTRPLGNEKDGVEIRDFAHDNFVQQAGPTAPPNTIAFNGRYGVAVLPPGTGNNIRHNNIFSNGSLGIEVNDDGVSENDPGDSDPGANNSQNYPLVTSVAPGTAAGTTVIQGTLNSKPNTVYSLDFFTNAGCDPSGFGEGARFFGGAGVMTDAQGNISFNVTIGQPFPVGRAVTATASTNAAPRDTSEFSPCSSAGAVGSAEFARDTFNFIEDIGDAPITVNRVGGSAGTLTVNYATVPGTATEGTDYTAVSGTITFAAGETSKTFTVPVVNDGVSEPDETVGLVLFSTTMPELVGARGRAAMTLVDGTTTPTLTFTKFLAALTEPLSGTTLAEYTVGLSAATGRTVSVHFQTSDGTATAGQDYQPVSLDLAFAHGEFEKHVSVVINGDTLDEPDNETFFVNLTNPVNATIGNEMSQVTISNNDTPVLQFSVAGYSVGEGAHAFAVTVARSGNKTGTPAIDYATSDGTASERSDYTKALGTLTFAPGETSKTFDVLLTDDAFVEGGETVNLALTNPTGGAVLVGNSSTVLTINDNDSAPGANPIDDSTFFVRQHYHDFLNRDPDAPGLAFWVNEIEKCGADQQCRDVRRINVSAAFFLSIEFQETGYLVYRTYKAAYGDAASPGVAGTVPVIRLSEFLADTQEIGRGVIVGQGAWQQQIETNKQDYFADFVSRARFTNAYPTTQSPAQFVDALFQKAGITPAATERDAAVAEFGPAADTSNQTARARALRRVSENSALAQADSNRAFVLMEYYGYLRRNPDDAPEPTLNFAGWKFWLNKLEQFNGNFVQAEMVKAFLSSDEYRHRFGQ